MHVHIKTQMKKGGERGREREKGVERVSWGAAVGHRIELAPHINANTNGGQGATRVAGSRDSLEQKLWHTF